MNILSPAVLALALLGASRLAAADFLVFTDRAAWQAAAGGAGELYEDFEEAPGDLTYGDPDLDFGFLNLDVVDGNVDNSWRIDTPPATFATIPSVNNTTFATVLGFSPDSSSFGNTRLGFGAVRAIGFDYRVGTYSNTGGVLITSLGDSAGMPTSGTGFVGVLYTDGRSFDSVVIRAVDNPIGRFGAGIDNVEAHVAIPGAENGIVGSWFFNVPPEPVRANTGGPVVFNLLDNGQFLCGRDGDEVADPTGQDGMEWGTYTYDGTELNFTTLLDTAGEWCPSSVVVGAVLDGNTLTLGGANDWVRITSTDLVGGWLVVGPENDESVSITFLDDGTFMLIHGDNPGDTCGCGQAGIEYGTYSWDAATNAISFAVQTDTNGEFGISHPLGGMWNSLVLTGDQFVISDSEDAFTFVRILAADDDGDGVNNRDDNCTQAANADQLDTDGDNLGNACDADLNGDCSVNFGDLAALKAAFFPSPYDEESDFNGDGFVNFGDLAIMKSTFFNGASPGPGPSGLPSGCP